MPAVLKESSAALCCWNKAKSCPMKTDTGSVELDNINTHFKSTGTESTNTRMLNSPKAQHQLKQFFCFFIRQDAVPCHHYTLCTQLMTPFELAATVSKEEGCC
ncbi:hypothetical protein MTO96_049234 [Rhipicephalus appendiculatus]